MHSQKSRLSFHWNTSLGLVWSLGLLLYGKGNALSTNEDIMEQLMLDAEAHSGAATPPAQSKIGCQIPQVLVWAWIVERSLQRPPELTLGGVQGV